MTAKIEDLTRQADATQAEIIRLDARIAAATAGLPDPFPEYVEEDGDYGDTTARSLPELRARRRELIELTDDVGEAIALLEARANDPKIKEREAAQAKARLAARQQAENHKAAASAVDDALRALEASFEAMDTSARLLRRALIQVGTDDVRISNQLAPSLRWALWRSAPRLAKAVGLSHTPFDKRRTLRDSASRVIPNIPAE